MKTWDGKSIAPEPPFAATVVVHRKNDSRTEFLLLHRGHNGPDYEGDWAWTPPGGARQPGEEIDSCAARELLEEAGIVTTPMRTSFGDEDCVVYVAGINRNIRVVLNDTEHDRFNWVSLDEARRRCHPDKVATAIARVAQSLNVNGVQ